jgi:undecaprenyl phosphate-alpha-L-ara4N flippase subunit ArnF
VTARLHRFAVLALVGSVLLSAWGQLSMKLGMQELDRALTLDCQLSDLAGMRTPATWTAIGLVSYGISLCLWIVVLVRFPLSFAYPLLSLSYGCVYLGAVFWPRLAETPTLSRSLGTLLILAGVALVSMSRTSRQAHRSPSAL